MIRAIVWLLVLGALGAGGWYWWKQRSAPPDPAAYRTAAVTRTDVVQTISASGTVVPEDVVDVGTQVNGQIASFGVGTDGKPVDYRSTVTEGAVLAKIDDTLYAADVAAGDAQLAQANAQVLGRATRTWPRRRRRPCRPNATGQRAQKLGAVQGPVAGGLRRARSRPSSRRRRASGSPKPRSRRRRPSVKSAEASLTPLAAQPHVLHDQVAGQRRHHRPARRHRADGRLEPERAEPLPDRQGPLAHAGARAGQRGRHRARQARRGRHVHHRRVPRRDVRRARSARCA